jgi:hypothetical protein
VQAGKTLDGKNPWRSCSTHIDSAEEIQDLVASLGEFFPRLAIIPVPTSVADHKTGVNSSTDHGGEKGGPIPIEVKPSFERTDWLDRLNAMKARSSSAAESSPLRELDGALGPDVAVARST